MGVTMTSVRCQAAEPCEQPPCFQARLEARIDRQPVSRTADLCPEHLSDAVNDLTAWANGSGLVDGFVTVLIIDGAEGALLSLENDADATPGVVPLSATPCIVNWR